MKKIAAMLMVLCLSLSVFFVMPTIAIVAPGEATNNNESVVADVQAPSAPYVKNAAAVNAIPAANMSLGNVTATQGETVDVNVVVAANPGIIACAFDVGYDASKLDLISTACGTVFPASAYLPTNDINMNPYWMTFEDSLNPDKTANGTIVTLKFQVLSSAAPGQTPLVLTLSKNNTINFNLDEVAFSTTNGSVNIEKKSPMAQLSVSSVGGGYVTAGIDGTTSDWGAAKVQSCAVGSNVTLTANERGGEATFMYWTNEHGRVASANPQYSFILAKDTVVKAVFSEKTLPTSPKYYVAFKDKNGNIVKSGYVTEGEAAVPPAADSLGYFKGYNFKGWDTSDYNKVTSNIVVTALYEIDKSTTYSVTATDPAIKIAGNRTGLQYESKVTASIDIAKIPPNKCFKGWSFDGGKTIAGYSENYFFYIFADVNLTAVYADNVNFEKKPVVVATHDVDVKNGKITLTSLREVLGGYTIMSHGFVITKKSNYQSQLDLANIDNVNIISRDAVDYSNKNGSFTVGTNAKAGDQVFYKAYIIYKDDATNKIITVYTDLMIATMV